MKFFFEEVEEAAACWTSSLHMSFNPEGVDFSDFLMNGALADPHL